MEKLSCPVIKQVSEQDFQTKSSNSKSHALPTQLCSFLTRESSTILSETTFASKRKHLQTISLDCNQISHPPPTIPFLPSSPSGYYFLPTIQFPPFKETIIIPSTPPANIPPPHAKGRPLTPSLPKHCPPFSGKFSFHKSHNTLLSP